VFRNAQVCHKRFDCVPDLPNGASSARTFWQKLWRRDVMTHSAIFTPSSSLQVILAAEELGLNYISKLVDTSKMEQFAEDFVVRAS
jgi:hypothetical protein